MKLQMLMMILVSGAMGVAQARAEDAAEGEALYQEVCRNCHGPSGRGLASFPSLLGRDADFIASRLETYRAGERVGGNSALMMPVAAELSDQEIADLAAYITEELG